MSGIAIREAYGRALRELGREMQDVVVLESDVGNSTRSVLFGSEFPERYFNVGIAESNMCGIAAGLASSGKIPFVNTFAVFMTTRALDPVTSLIAYPNLNVKLAGAYAGFSDSYDGATHNSVSDIAVTRSIPNMNVVCVSDAIQTTKATKAIAKIQGPVYLRLSRAVVPDVFDESYEFEFGKGIVLREGEDLTLVATGYMLQKSLQAAKELEKQGISAKVVNIHTIKPIDEELLIESAEKTGLIITVEEHSVIGGLGAAVAEVLSEKCPTKLVRIGAQDRFGESGDYEPLLTKFGLCSDNIAIRAKQALEAK